MSRNVKNITMPHCCAKVQGSSLRVSGTKWLMACPEKGYFVPIESESTDTL
jgi:hypothetical protein